MLQATTYIPFRISSDGSTTREEFPLVATVRDIKEHFLPRLLERNPHATLDLVKISFSGTALADSDTVEGANLDSGPGKSWPARNGAGRCRGRV